MKNVYLALILSAFSSASLAEHEGFETYTTGVLGGGYAFGGEKIDDIEFEGGYNDSIRVGSGFFLNAGFRTQFEHIALKGTFGYKADSVIASNGDSTFSSLPLTFVASYSHSDNNFGIGFTHEFSPKYDVDFDFEDYTVDFKDATGLVLEYERSQGQWGWGVRYTMIDYKLDQAGGDISFDGDNLGVFAHWYF